MNMSTFRATLALAVLAGPGIASAQTFDHLKCYKISDESSYTALANLDTNSLQAAAFPNETGCKISVRSKEFCVPVSKTRFVDPGNPKEAPEAELVGQELQNDFLCYKVRCEAPATTPPASQVVHDQFGARAISRFKTAKVCTPAVKLSGGPYEDPLPLSAILRQTYLGSSLDDFQVDLFTSLDAEYEFTGLTGATAPPGWSVSGVEVEARRDCASGSVAMGPSGGCGQVWTFRFTPDAGTCSLTGTFTATFRYGCNADMPNCSLVNFALPDHTVTVNMTSSSFCP